MPILAFHNNSVNLMDGLNNYHPSRLKRLIEFLIASQHKIVSLDEYIETSDTSHLIALTFDDGYESFYTNIYPMLKEKHLPSALFIPAKYIGRTNNWDYSGTISPISHLNEKEIKKLSGNGVTIGSHSLTHRALSDLSERLLTLELTRSKEIIEGIIGKKIGYISYPFGRYNSYVETMALKSGYRAGFSLSKLRQGRGGFTFPRFAVYAFDTPYSVAQKVGDGRLNYIERLKGVIMNSYAGGTIALNKIRRNN